MIHVPDPRPYCLLSGDRLRWMIHVPFHPYVFSPVIV